MRILETRVYRGPNLYALWPVIRLHVDLEELEEFPTVKLPGFADGLLALLPTLAEHTCSYDEPGGFVRRMTEDEGTWMGHVLEHVTIELQVLVGTPVSFGKTRGANLPRGHYHVVYSYQEEAVSLAARDLALRTIRHLLPPERADHDPGPLDFPAELRALRGLVERFALGPSTAALVRAAEERDIPWMRLNDGALIQLGHGCHQQRIEAAVTSGTPLTAVELAGDKSMTHRILADLAIPVPRQEVVTSVEAALGAAERLGYPVVVKPLDGNQGRGVSTGLTVPDQVRSAWDRAAEISREVLVETHQAGCDYRILVVGGKVVAVAQRVPGHVVGNGLQTVRELVDQVNSDPRRGHGHEKSLTRIELDDEALRLLAEAALMPASVLPAGEAFFLRTTGNLSTGGTAIDRTDDIHPDNRRMAERAARAIGLDVAGVDFLSPDISRSYREVGGAIVELNAGPGLRMHLDPSEGLPRDVAGSIIEMLFPRGRPARIPLAAITGTNGKTTTTRMVGHILTQAGFHVGMATTDGVYIDGVRIAEGDLTGPWSSRLVLRDPTVDAAVLETARGGIVRAGLGWRKCNVGAVLNVAADHLGLGGIDDLDELARVKQIVVEVARDYCVLNADDPRVAQMAAMSPGQPIYVSLEPPRGRVRRHVRSRGKAVVLEAGKGGDRLITFHDGGKEIPLLWVRQIPASLAGSALHNVQNAMFAAAVAHGLGVSLEVIRQGLRTFRMDFEATPGRLNFYDRHPFKVLLDYAHNAHGMEAIARTAANLAVAGRRLAVIASPGDRRDEDALALDRAAAPVFDLFVLREDDDLRGRAPGETGELLRQGLLAAGVGRERILPEVLGEAASIDRALHLARPGDLVVIFGDKLERCWRQITGFDPAQAAATTTEAPTLPELVQVQR
ncbi:MAG TPA: cyanophycin synthetase [Thermoanaerobaculia bacterium]|nr:cyanophycin synthetase [Thermoanaerobaculia bacterium]